MQRLRSRIGLEKFGRIGLLCQQHARRSRRRTGGIEGLDVDLFDAAMATLLRA